MKGLTGYVCRPADWEREGVDCTNGGISSRHEKLTVVGVVRGDLVNYLPQHARVFEPTEERPAVLVEVRRIGGPVFSVVPAEIADGALFKAPGWWMAGGNYLSCSDSRLWDFLQDLTGERFYGALSIHDRKE